MLIYLILAVVIGIVNCILGATFLASEIGNYSNMNKRVLFILCLVVLLMFFIWYVILPYIL